jgi:transcriptional regulator with XRE-family HTH domain
MELRQAFGSNVRHHRRAVGITQEKLAEIVEVSIETIGKIERGVAAPSFDTVEKIATALCLSPLALFGATDAATPKGERGKLLVRIQQCLAAMNENQLARAANILDAFMGR